MEIPDLSKIRRLSLGSSIVLITLILAEVRLVTPATVTPLGIPLIITRPDLLNIGLLIVSMYSTLRYIYYGMLIKASPMHARKLLLSGMPVRARTYGARFDDFVNDIKVEVSRYFPPLGQYKVMLHFPKQAADSKEYKFTLAVPSMLKAIYWIEYIDFMLPPISSLCAILLYIVTIVRKVFAAGSL